MLDSWKKHNTSLANEMWRKSTVNRGERNGEDKFRTKPHSVTQRTRLGSASSSMFGLIRFVLCCNPTRQRIKMLRKCAPLACELDSKLAFRCWKCFDTRRWKIKTWDFRMCFPKSGVLLLLLLPRCCYLKISSYVYAFTVIVFYALLLHYSSCCATFGVRGCLLLYVFLFQSKPVLSFFLSSSLLYLCLLLSTGNLLLRFVSRRLPLSCGWLLSFDEKKRSGDFH